MAASTAKPLALANARAVTPGAAAPAPDGERAFLDTMTRLAEGAHSLDGAWQGFRKTCFTGTIAGTFSHEWLVMLTPRAITPAQAGGGTCPSFVIEFQKEANRLGQEMRTALEDARRAGVLPGEKPGSRSVVRWSPLAVTVCGKRNRPGFSSWNTETPRRTSGTRSYRSACGEAAQVWQILQPASEAVIAFALE